jgi:hypothetical protein
MAAPRGLAQQPTRELLQAVRGIHVET